VIAGVVSYMRLCWGGFAGLVVSVACCQVGLREGPITRPEELYQVCVCVTECDHVQQLPPTPWFSNPRPAKLYYAARGHICKTACTINISQ